MARSLQLHFFVPLWQKGGRATLFSLTLWLLEKVIVTEDSVPSLEAILEHTLFNTREELLAQFDPVPGKKGMCILIWNIRRYRAGVCGEAAVPRGWARAKGRDSFRTAPGLGGLSLLSSTLATGGTNAGISPFSLSMTECLGCHAGS